MFLGPELPGQLVGGAPVRGVVAGKVDLVGDLDRCRVLLDGRHVLVLKQPEIFYFYRFMCHSHLQSNPLNGSPDNGSIRLLVQVMASPNSMPDE